MIHKLLNASKVNPESVRELTLSSQAETLIIIDAESNPIRKAIVWFDNRLTVEAKEIEERFSRQFIMDITGWPEVVPTWLAARILWLRKNKPGTFRKVFKYLLVEDYLMYKMTSKYHTEYSLVSSTLYFDISKKK